jgi:hypothetical protein
MLCRNGQFSDSMCVLLNVLLVLPLRHKVTSTERLIRGVRERGEGTERK